MSFILTACGGGGGGGGGNTPASGTTTVTGKVTLSSTVAKPKRTASTVVSYATGTEGLADATVELYNADKPEWLYPVASVLSDSTGVYLLSSYKNAGNNGNAYTDNASIPKGNYTIIAYKYDSGRGKLFVAVQPYVKMFEGDVVGNDLLAQDSGITPAVVSMFGLAKNPDGSYGNTTYELSQNAALQVTFNTAMARLSVLAAISIKNSSNTAVQGVWKVSADLLSATFYPSDSLTIGNVYTVTVRGGSDTNDSTLAKNLYGNPISATVTGTFITKAADTTPPNAVADTPDPANPTNVPISTPIRIGANEPLDVNTMVVTSAPSIGDKPAVTYVGYDAAKTYKYIYEILPANALQLNQDYAITVSGAKDMAGNLMTSLTFNFKTAATATLPVVVSVSPTEGANGVAVNAAVSAVFSTLMDDSTITQANFTLNNGSSNLAGATAFDATTRTATFTPSSNLAYGMTYTATINTGVKDKAGNGIATPKVWSFTTVGPPDTTPPTVSFTSPSHNATGVALTETITATFSEAMDPSTLSAATFMVYFGGNYLTGTVKYNGSTVTFTPSGSMMYNTTYTATITTGAKDLTGNALVSDSTWTFTTMAPSLVSIAVAPAAPSMAKGTTQQFAATATYSDNSTQDVTATATWTSGTLSTATINANGLASAVNIGSSVITATFGGKTATATITVTAATLSSLSVTPASISIAAGTTRQFTATGTFSDGSTQDVTASTTWTSGAMSVATISAGGLVTALNTGSSVITATYGVEMASATLTVTAATLSSIIITPAAPSIIQSATQQFTATGTFSDSSSQDVTSLALWTSDNESTATITTGGMVTAIGVGVSTITATYGGLSGSTTLTVTAPTLTSIAVTPLNPSIAKGTTQQFIATGTYSDNSTFILTSVANWASGTASVATITSTGGLAAAAGVGTSTITATYGGKSGSTTLTVSPPTLTSITVTPANPSISKGTTQQFTATGTYTDATTADITASVTWSSTVTSVATISVGGLASAGGAGVSTITATSGSISGSATLTAVAATWDASSWDSCVWEP